MARPDSGAVPRRAHHISSIAHLFLQEDGAKGDREPASAVRDIAVAAPGGSPISAFAAAGLALGLSRYVTLSEDQQLRWSAGTFLAREEGNARIHASGNEIHPYTWAISPGAAAASGEDESSSAGVRQISWSHLGCLEPGGLAHLESLAVARSLIDLPLKRSGGLVWCLLAQEAGRLGPSYILGRLVELTRPGRIEILLFPDAWSDAGRPGWLEEIHRNEFSPDNPEDLTRCAELAELACDGIPLKIHRVSGSDNLTGSFGGNGQQKSLWRRVALSMMSVCLVMAGIPLVAAGESPPPHTLGRPGYLVIEAARDSAAGFRWEAGPGPGRRSLVWDQGRLILPDTFEAEDFAERDVGVPCTARLAGTGASGQLVLRDGIYPVSEPVVLSDGRLELRVSAGELEFRGARIRYRRAVDENREFRSGLLLLAGVTLMVIVLLRRASLKAGGRTGA